MVETQARAVIVGAGIVGSALAYHLAARGWRDVVVLDQGPLFHNWGSTSHAPGMMFQHNASRTMCRFAMWSAELYAEQAAEGEQIFHRVGSMEVAPTPERWRELKRRVGQCRSWGLGADLIDPNAISRMIPIMRVDDLFGALFVPGDCVVKPAAVAEALARKAGANGARIHPRTPVEGIEVERGRVTAVRTRRGRIRTDTVVCAAGIWGPLVGRLAGVHLPLTPMQHLLVRTGPVAELAGETAEIRHPIVRDQDVDLYFRQYGEAYAFGSYRHEPLPVDPERIQRNETPAILPFTPEHFRDSLRDGYARMPALERAGIVHEFNGLFSFTPDGFPILGESADVRGFWSAEAVWITHAGGVARAVAEWMDEGVPSIDLRECDINRFQPHALTRSYVKTRSRQQYVEVYDVIHPQQQIGAPRGLRRSPFHDRLVALGAEFFESAGWERPQWFRANEALLRALPDAARGPERSAWTGRHWSPIIAAEHAAARDRVALFDLTPFAKIEVAGSGALGFLQRLCSNQMDRPVGRVTYTAMLDHRGGIQCDLTITRLGPNRFLVVTGGVTRPRDLAWMQRHLPDDGSVHLTDLSSAYACVGLWGPRARDLVQRVSDDDFTDASFPYFSAREVAIGYLRALALRVSYVGELGWELYAPVEYGQLLWETLWEAGRDFGVAAAGGGAFDSLRLEKGYRLWGQDIHSEYNPYEAGLSFAVALGKDDFIGKEALERIREEGTARRLSCLTFQDPAVIVMGKEPVLDGERVVGYVTSANYGFTVRQSIAYSYLPLHLTAPGTTLRVQFFGERYPVTVAAEPLYDPEAARVKGRRSGAAAVVVGTA